MLEITEDMIRKGAHVLSEWLDDEAPLHERRYRDPAKAAFAAMLALTSQPAPEEAQPSQAPIPLSAIHAWHERRLKACGLEGVTDPRAWAEEAIRWAETQLAAPPATSEDRRDAADLLALQRFADAVMADWPEGGDVDGFALQEIAVACGLLKEETVTVPCGDTCSCAENGVEDGPAECFRVQPVYARARRAAMAASSATEQGGEHG